MKYNGVDFHQSAILPNAQHRDAQNIQQIHETTHTHQRYSFHPKRQVSHVGHVTARHAGMPSEQELTEQCKKGKSARQGRCDRGGAEIQLAGV